MEQMAFLEFLDPPVFLGLKVLTVKLDEMAFLVLLAKAVSTLLEEKVNLVKVDNLVYPVCLEKMDILASRVLEVILDHMVHLVIQGVLV